MVLITPWLGAPSAALVVLAIRLYQLRCERCRYRLQRRLSRSSPWLRHSPYEI